MGTLKNRTIRQSFCLLPWRQLCEMKVSSLGIKSFNSLLLNTGYIELHCKWFNLFHEFLSLFNVLCSTNWKIFNVSISTLSLAATHKMSMLFIKVQSTNCVNVIARKHGNAFNIISRESKAVKNVLVGDHT